MKVSLSTSLHSNHARMSVDHRPGDEIPEQPFVPAGLSSLQAYAEQRGSEALRITEMNGMVASRDVKRRAPVLPRAVSDLVVCDLLRTVDESARPAFTAG